MGLFQTFGMLQMRFGTEEKGGDLWCVLQESFVS
jgi:hypothetical protein